MTPLRNGAAAPWAKGSGGGRTLESDIAGELIESEDNFNPLTFQVSRLRRKFGLAEPVARTVAEMAFGWRTTA
jgi:hypothetical protein